MFAQFFSREIVFRLLFGVCIIFILGNTNHERFAEAVLLTVAVGLAVGFLPEKINKLNKLFEHKGGKKAKGEILNSLFSILFLLMAALSAFLYWTAKLPQLENSSFNGLILISKTGFDPKQFAPFNYSDKVYRHYQQFGTVYNELLESSKYLKSPQRTGAFTQDLVIATAMEFLAEQYASHWLLDREVVTERLSSSRPVDRTIPMSKICGKNISGAYGILLRESSPICIAVPKGGGISIQRINENSSTITITGKHTAISIKIDDRGDYPIQGSPFPDWVIDDKAFRSSGLETAIYKFEITAQNKKAYWPIVGTQHDLEALWANDLVKTIASNFDHQEFIARLGEWSVHDALSRNHAYGKLH